MKYQKDTIPLVKQPQILLVEFPKDKVSLVTHRIQQLIRTINEDKIALITFSFIFGFMWYHNVSNS